MNMLATRYGELPVTGLVDRYPDGAVREVFLAGPVSLATPVGDLCPQHTIDDARRQHLAPLTFHPNGRIHSLPLERQTVIATPIGELPAELVTFHANGTLARVFPLNGKLSGYWTEADEARQAKRLTLSLRQGTVTARFVAVAFTEAGKLRSLTLWPDEEVTIESPVGPLPARLGISLYPDGSLRSLEPARPVEVPTPIGPIWAFDPDAVGVCGDANSLAFSRDGTIERIATVRTAVTALLPDGVRRTVAPGLRESLCGDGDHEPVALLLAFHPDRVEARTDPRQPPIILPTAGTHFATRPSISAFAVPLTPRHCSV